MVIVLLLSFFKSVLYVYTYMFVCVYACWHSTFVQQHLKHSYVNAYVMELIPLSNVSSFMCSLYAVTKWSLSEGTPPILPDCTVEPTGVSLGTGSFAEVIEVKFNNQVYAAKKYHNADKKKLLPTIGQEIKLHSRLKHPNIVSYCGFCKVKGSHTKVIVMERMHQVLESFLKQTPNITEARKFQILHDILLGLHHLHTRDPAIIHRDLTATNVLLDSNGVAKIGDFGNSCMIDLNPDLSPELMTSKPGTLDYMPPETQGEDEEEEEHKLRYNEKLDIFSFGHLSLFIMNQKRPKLVETTYKDEISKKIIARTEIQRRDRHIKEMKSKLHGGDKHPLYSIIVSCLHDDPEQRPQCSDILHDFLLTGIESKGGEKPPLLSECVGEGQVMQEGGVHRKCSEAVFSELVKPGSLCNIPEWFSPVATLSQCTHDGRHYYDEANNFSLDIPEGAIPEGDNITIDIGVALYGPFQYPEGLRPVSPVFWVCVRGQKSFCFLKPVTVTMQHFLNLKNHDDIESLEVTFLKGDHELNMQQLHKFQKTEGYFFVDPLKKCGKLQITHFCSLCISSQISRRLAGMEVFCISAIIPRTFSPTQPSYAYFYITYMLATCLTTVKRQIQDVQEYEEIIQELQFEDQFLEIVLSQSPPGWNLGLQCNTKV